MIARVYVVDTTTTALLITLIGAEKQMGGVSRLG